MNIIIGILEQGLIYAIVALGMYISFKILDFPDMGIEGSFTLGGAVTAILIINNVNPIYCLLISILLGACAGSLTGIINVKLKVRDLLSGIIVMMILYSLNLRIVGKSNVSIYNLRTIFNNSLVKNGNSSEWSIWIHILIIIVIVLLCKLILDYYLKTKSGYLLKAVGENTNVVSGIGKNPGTIKIIGIAIANSLAALGGSVLCQQQCFYDISMGSGILIVAITSVMIGLILFKENRIINNTFAVIIGSILYKSCVTFALKIGFEATDLKLITALLFLTVLLLKGDFFKGVLKNDRIKTSK